MIISHLLLLLNLLLKLETHCIKQFWHFSFTPQGFECIFSEKVVCEFRFKLSQKYQILWQRPTMTSESSNQRLKPANFQLKPTTLLGSYKYLIILLYWSLSIAHSFIEPIYLFCCRQKTSLRASTVVLHQKGSTHLVFRCSSLIEPSTLVAISRTM